MSWTREMKNLANALWDLGAFRSKERSKDGKGFKLKLHEEEPDAPLSPFYLNLRMPPDGPLTQEIMDLAGQQLFVMAKREELVFTCVAGLPKAGDPIADSFLRAVSADDQHPNHVVLSKEETNGNRHITGIASDNHAQGDKVLVIDDLITKADTKLEGIFVLRTAGLEVEDVVVLVNRQQGGAQQLAEAGCNLHALFELDELLEHYVEARSLCPVLQKAILKYVRGSQH